MSVTGFISAWLRNLGPNDPSSEFAQMLEEVLSQLRSPRPASLAQVRGDIHRLKMFAIVFHLTTRHSANHASETRILLLRFSIRQHCDLMNKLLQEEKSESGERIGRFSA
jgi:hypothetical protein